MDLNYRDSYGDWQSSSDYSFISFDAAASQHELSNSFPSGIDLDERASGGCESFSTTGSASSGKLGVDGNENICDDNESKQMRKTPHHFAIEQIRGGEVRHYKPLTFFYLFLSWSHSLVLLCALYTLRKSDPLWT